MIPTQNGEDIELTRRQKRLYTYTCDIWATDRGIDVSTGEPYEGTWRRVGIDIPCLYEYTSNVDDTTQAGRIKRDILDTTDHVHFPIGVRLSNDWWVVNTTLDSEGNPTPTHGDLHRIVGAPQKLPRFDVQIVNATQEEKPPKTLTQFLEQEDE